MSWYRRANFAGGYYFFTVVTHQRQQFLCDELARDCLRSAWQRVASDRPFESIALCLLPNHLHAIWRLPDDDADFSSRWKLIKMFFTHLYLQNSTRGPEGPPYACSNGQTNANRRRRREAGIWQRRFWEHQIRDENDLQKHVDYTHYNPVKHGLADDVADWPWSTYHRYVKAGWYREKDFDLSAFDDEKSFGE